MFRRVKRPARETQVLVAGAAALGVLLLSPGSAAAQDFLTQDNANILWTLVAAILVMFMQAGFACVEAGFTRAKSAGNIIMKNFLDFGAGQIMFFLLGFGLMFGVGSQYVGLSYFGLGGIAEADLPWAYTFWFFQ
ncbi:MAG: ammonium transporter, partial [Desulfohalobiaceae bacterium]